MARFVAFEVPGEAVAFARAGKHGKRHFTPAKQLRYMALIRAAALKAMCGEDPITGPVEFALRATYVAPESWSQKKRSAAKWKQSKPDWDNLAKLASDAMNQIVYVDDAQIASAVVQKRYGVKCGVMISVMQLGDAE